MALGGRNEGKSKRLEMATERFEAAMERLEKAVAAQKKSAPGVDMEQIAQEAADLRTQNDRLNDLNKSISERLDGTIQRLNVVLADM